MRVVPAEPPFPQAVLFKGLPSFEQEIAPASPFSVTIDGFKQILHEIRTRRERKPAFHHTFQQFPRSMPLFRDSVCERQNIGQRRSDTLPILRREPLVRSPGREPRNPVEIEFLFVIPEFAIERRPNRFRLSPIFFRILCVSQERRDPDKGVQHSIPERGHCSRSAICGRMMPGNAVLGTPVDKEIVFRLGKQSCRTGEG